MMMTVRGKIQRVAAKDISVIGRNTQGVRVMSLDENDTLTAIVRVPPDEIDESAIMIPEPPVASSAGSSSISDAVPFDGTDSVESDGADTDSDMDESDEDSLS
jgi:DNA gyrase subunit A